MGDRTVGDFSDLSIQAEAPHGFIVDERGRRIRNATEEEADLWDSEGQLLIEGRQCRLIRS